VNVYTPIFVLGALAFGFAAFSVVIATFELVFLDPWAVSFDALGAFGLVAMMLFLLNLAVPYVYEWRRGGLEWD
jgi:NADH-quinone oxidoreductase subunit A